MTVIRTLRHLTASSLAVAIAIGVGLNVGSTASADEPSGRVVWVSANPVPVVDAIAEMFMEKYPGVTVETLAMGAGEALSRIRAEAANPQIDVWSGGGAHLRAAAYDLLDSYQSTEDAAFGDDVKDTEGYRWYGFSGPSQIFLINTDLIPDEADHPMRWTDLGDEKYRGQIIMANPALSSSAFSQMMLMLHNGGWELVEDVVKNATVTPSSRLAWQGVGDGEYAIGMASENSVLSLIHDDYPIRAIYPEDGTNLSFDTVSIIANSPNPENARLLLDFINSQQAHEIIVEPPHFRRSVRPDVATMEAMVPREEMTFVEYSDEELRQMSEDRDQLLEEFDEVFALHGS